MKSYRHKIYLLGFVLFASMVRAGESFSLAEVSPQDPSYQFLTYLFGTVSSDLMCYTGSCSLLVPKMFSVLNQGLLSIASLLMTYVLLVSVGSSAHEGEFMGKKGSSLWVPVRISAGIGFLIPSETGYSALQAMLMKFILLGISIGNSLYSTVGNYVLLNDRSFAREFSSEGSSLTLLHDVIRLSATIFKYELCYAGYQQEQPFDQDLEAIGLTSTQTMLKGPTQLSCSDSNKPFFGYEYTTDEQQFSTGCSFTSPAFDLCGSWKYYYADSDVNKSGTQAAIETLTLNIRTVANTLVDQWFNVPNGATENPDMADALAVSAEKNMMMQSILTGVADLVSSNSIDIQDSEEAIFDSYWVNFPVEFYNWIDKGTSKMPSLGEFPETEGVAMQGEGISNGSESYRKLRAKLKDYDFFNASEIQRSENNTNSNRSNSIEQTVANQFGKIGSSLSNEFDKMEESLNYGPAAMMYGVMKAMMNGSSEPLIALAMFGQFLLKMSIITIMTSIILGVAMVGATATCASFFPGFSIGGYTAGMGFLASLLMAFGFLIPIGVVLGIYLPLMPGITYASGVVIWFMMVIEAMVAGPVIALGLMSPGQESLGKAQPAILMMLNVVIRPGLMVMGMVFGAKMFDLFALYFSTIMLSGFAFISKKAGFNGFYFMVFIMFWFFYSFSIVGVAQRCYSLIYVLPDKVITWIGGQGGSSREIQEDLNTLKQAGEKGGDAVKTQTESLSSGFQKTNESLTAYYEQKK